MNSRDEITLEYRDKVDKLVEHIAEGFKDFWDEHGEGLTTINKYLLECRALHVMSHLMVDHMQNRLTKIVTKSNEIQEKIDEKK